MESFFERPRPNMTFMMNSTMALPGWSASSSAKMWQALSVGLPCFLATKPNILQSTVDHRMNRKDVKQHYKNEWKCKCVRMSEVRGLGGVVGLTLPMAHADRGSRPV